MWACTNQIKISLKWYEYFYLSFTAPIYNSAMIGDPYGGVIIVGGQIDSDSFSNSLYRLKVHIRSIKHAQLLCILTSKLLLLKPFVVKIVLFSIFFFSQMWEKRRTNGKKQEKKHIYRVSTSIQVLLLNFGSLKDVNQLIIVLKFSIFFIFKLCLLLLHSSLPGAKWH